METLTNDQFLKLIKESWSLGEEEFNVTSSVAHVIKGKPIFQGCKDTGEHEVYFAIFKDPQHRITSDQLCDIFDTGNHCISSGSIVYEQNYAYIIWSNLGHI